MNARVNVLKSSMPVRSEKMRTYVASDVVSFFTTSGPFGGLSNMARGYPITFGDLELNSSECLYQTLRFPHLPDFQAEIINTPNPIASKRLAYERIDETRPDWMHVRIPFMRYALALKHACNQEAVRNLFIKVNGRPIVEISRRDDYWGTFDRGNMLHGQNVLGRLLMELSAKVLDVTPGSDVFVMPPDGIEILVLGQKITELSFKAPVENQITFEF